MSSSAIPLILRILLSLILPHVLTQVYNPENIFSGIMYYKISPYCSPRDNQYEAEFYCCNEYPREIDKKTLIYSQAGDKESSDENAMYVVESDALEVYILKAVMSKVRVIAPNLRAFVVLDTGNFRVRNDFWQFPKLEVLILYQIHSNKDLIVPHYQSNSLRTLTMLNIESTIVRFEWDDRFINLTTFQLTSIEWSSFKKLCSFVARLRQLERLHLSNIKKLDCLDKMLPKLRDVWPLKIVQLYEMDMIFTDANFCSFFPPDVKIISIQNIESTGTKPESSITPAAFDCLEKVQRIEVAINFLPNSTHFSARSPSIALHSAKPFTSTLQNMSFVGLTDARAVTIDNAATQSTSLPALPKAEMLRFTRNGFRFTKGEGAFEGLSNLRILDLSQNPIQHIPEGAFNTLPKLALLVIQHVELTTFDSTVFCHLRWPQLINFGELEEAMVNFRPAKQNSLNCLLVNSSKTNIVLMSVNCSCQSPQISQLSPDQLERHLVLDAPVCSGDNAINASYFESSCAEFGTYMTPIEDFLTKPLPTFMSDSPVLRILLFAIIILYPCLVLVPVAVMYILHKRDMRGKVVASQLTQEPEKIFIICPKHAHNWCRRVIIPCLEADLFVNNKPLLFRTKRNGAHMDSVSLGRSGMSDPRSSNFVVRSHDKQNSNITSSNSFEVDENLPHSVIEDVKSSDAWAWRPRLKCFQAPPARHRLKEMIASKHVLIIFPSVSLFTESACRAQLRIAYHLFRIRHISPPIIITWPSSKGHLLVPQKIRSINVLSSIRSEDKLYPVPAFNSVTNNPEDIVETEPVKAKVPTSKEAVRIMKSFCQDTCPFIQWNNSLSARSNMVPLVWRSNIDSRIPQY